MIKGFAYLVGFQLIGEILATAFRLPIPGPICGMAVLLTMLCIKGQLPVEIETTADGLLKYLPILFVPAGVGVIVYADLFQEYGLQIAVLLSVSTAVTLVVTAAVSQAVSGFKLSAGIGCA